MEDLKNFFNLAEGLEKTVQIEIVGHADSLGTEKGNLVISQERAEKVLALILKEGLDATKFSDIRAWVRASFSEKKKRTRTGN